MNTFQRKISDQLKIIKNLSVNTKKKEVDFLLLDKEVEKLKEWIKAYNRYLFRTKEHKSKFTRPHCNHCTNNRNGTCIPRLMQKGLRASAPVGFSKHCTNFTPTDDFKDCYSPEVMEKIRGGNYGN